MEELTEDNDFGLALAERPSITNQGYIIFLIIYLFFNFVTWKCTIYTI